MNKKKICSIIVGITLSTSVLSQPLIVHAETTQDKSIEKNDQQKVENINTNDSKANSDKSKKQGLTIEKRSLSTNSEVVNIPDANFKAILNQKLGQASDANITKEQLSTIKSIAGRMSNIKSIDGIQYCTSLETLSLSENHISDISYLKGLTNLTLLQIGSNQISDISALKGLTKLEWVYLDDQNITLDSIYSKGDYAESSNPIKDENNNSVVPTDISNGGVYDSNTNQVKWSNITNNVNETYKFNKNLSIGKADFEFSGVVTQPIKYNSIPIINAKDETITVGDKFDPLAGVTAEDKEDGNLTKDIKVIKDTVNTNTSGKYEVTYEVIDKQGATGTKTITVTVDPKVEYVNIPDANFKAVLNKELGQASDANITKDQLSTIRNIKGRYKNIQSIEGIQYCTSLENLNLGNNHISDISYLEGLKNLNDIELGDNNISNISALSSLTNLKNLGLRANKISDLSALEGLTNLSDLNIGNNEISNISDLKGLTNLTALELGNNQISNISDLKDLINLTTLGLNSNQISNISDLKGLTNLTELQLGNNQISDISDLKGLVNLISLDLSTNQISNIQCLKNLTSLTNVHFDNNQISDISYLKGLTNLTNLQLGNNNISNISDLKGLINLTYLELGNNQISDISDLKGLTNLTWLDLKSQDITLNSIYSVGKYAESNNPIKDKDNNAVVPIDISNEGIYDSNTNKVKWNNITDDINETYKFNKNVSIGEANCEFSGTVIQPIKYNSIPTINAKDETIKIGDKFDPLAGVTATDKEDGNITKDIKVIENTVNTSKLGTYKVVYEVTDSQGAKTTKTITVIVRSNDKPLISGVGDVSITEGDKFDPMAGVTATDTEDGNITKDIKVTGTVDVNKPGKYELTYTVTDKDGNTTTVKRIVTVNLKWTNINAVPTITAENKTIKVGDKFDPLAGVTATDKEDGNVTKDIKIIENTVDTSKPGTYKVIYEVTDSQGAKTTKTITVIVRSNDKPVISGVGNVSIKEGDKFDPMAGVTATDTEDGNITKDIKVTGTVDANKPGKYELTYTVTDADGNITTVKRIVTVNLKWTNINAVPTITAENKTIKVGDKFDPLAGVTAADKEDGNVTKDIKVIENTVNTSKPGTYKVVYEVTDSQGAKTTKTITVIVRSNDKPVISGVGNVSITEGDKFDPMAGVTATDTEDGNITKDIKVTGTVDVNKPGKYELTYTVTDADGNTTTVKRVVTVNLKWTNINAVPTITAENKTIKVGDKFDPLAGVTATDKEDGNVTKDIKVIENTVNTSKPGTYKVVYEVTDSQGAKTTKTITVTVRSNDKPVISGVGNVSITEGDKFDPMSGVTATDTEDGNITKDIKVTGTVDVNKPGKYELTYTVTDADGNTTTVKRVVTVNLKWININAVPTITAENKTIKVGDKFDPLAGVTATDKEDGDLTKDIKVIENTVDASKPGIYKVVYEVTDSQGAKATKTITVTVRSNDKPVISGVGNVSITEGDKFDPMAGVTATDTEDGNITKDIKVTGTVDVNKPGKYELTYTVTDKDGNTTTVKRVVTVNLKWANINAVPTINAKDETIKVGDKFDPLAGVTAEDNEDGNLTKDIKVVKNTVDTNTPGKYEVTYEVTDKQGATGIKTITVTVTPKDDNKDTINNPNENKDTINNSNNSNESDKVKELPKTGYGDTLSYIGAIMTSLGGALVLKKKKRK